MTLGDHSTQVDSGVADESTPLLFPSFNAKELKSSKHSVFRRYLGIFLAVFASFLLSLTTLIARVLIEYHPLNAALWRFIGFLLPSIPISVWKFCSSKPILQEQSVSSGSTLKTVVVVLIRSACGCIAVIFQFYALSYITIGDVTVISFTTPVFVTLMAYCILGEPLGIVPVVNALLTVIGIGIITRPPMLSGAQSFDPNYIIGTSLAMGCMIFAAFTYIALRWLKTVHYSLLTLSYGGISVIVCSICSLSIGVFQPPQSLDDWVLAISLGGLSFAGQSLFTLALKYEDAGPVALTRTCEVLFTFLWQVVFLGDIPDAFSVVGSFLILLTVLMTTLRKLVMELPAGSSLRFKLEFLLM